MTDTVKKKIVVVGGGTGTHSVLSGLKHYQDRVSLSAVVTMADSGGSSGRLRDEFGYLPVGDVRMALAALAREDDEQESLIRQLFLHRFDKGEGLSGHNVGNLLLVALTDLLGSEEAAIRAAARVLRVEGEVIPVTTTPVELKAQYEDDTVIVGEHRIDESSPARRGTRIRKLSASLPASVNPAAASALREADLIVLGPGDLYTSVLANCVVDGVVDAIKGSRATLVYVTNLMTKVGQTEGFGASRHLDAITEYLGRTPDVVVVNQAAIDSELLARYAEDGEVPVVDDCADDACRVVRADLVASTPIVQQGGDTLKRSLIRHDADALARVLVDLVA